MERKEVPCEIKRVDDNEAIIIASVFGNIDKGGDMVQSGAFRKTLNERVKARKVNFIDGHQNTASATKGTVVEGKEVDEGLQLRVEFASTKDAQQLRTKMKEDHVNTYSIGYRVHEQDHEKIDGERVRVLKELELLEVSALPVAMNDQTRTVAVKGLLDKVENGGDLSDDEIKAILRLAGDVQQKRFPERFPFDDFEGCVQHFRDDPEVDDPEKLCGSLEQEVVKGDSDMQTKQFSDEQIQEIMGVIGGAIENGLEARLDNISSTLEENGFSGEELEEIMGAVGAVLEARIDGALNEIESELQGDSEEEDNSEQNAQDEEEMEQSGTHKDEMDKDDEKALSNNLAQFLSAEIEWKAESLDEEQEIIEAISYDCGVEEKQIENIIYGKGEIPSETCLKSIADVLDVPKGDVIELAEEDGFSGKAEDSDESSIDQKLMNTKGKIVESSL